MIPRNITPVLQRRLLGFPVVVITGPRQSGKTTVAKSLANGRPYVTLEDLDVRSFAQSDPRRFLAQFPDGAILDEVQRCPSLFSYLQGVVDSDPRTGRFILTGSQQFGMIEAITQSLAGRVSLLQLHPFSITELQTVNKSPKDLDTLLAGGLFPPLYDRDLDAHAWLQSYIATYLERDVRQTLTIQDLATFQRFLQLCAGRIGQLLNVSSLASDVGISRSTAEAWLSVLQASYLVTLVRPFFGNLSKRLIKAPKLYFCDPGIAAWLLGIRQSSHLHAHPLRGLLFENWVMTELLKAQVNRGETPSVNFWRDKEGHEVDFIVQNGPVVHAIEVKAGQTVASDFFDGLDFWRKHTPDKNIRPWLVFGGDSPQSRSDGEIVPWKGIGRLLEAL